MMQKTGLGAVALITALAGSPLYAADQPGKAGIFAATARSEAGSDRSTRMLEPPVAKAQERFRRYREASIRSNISGSSRLFGTVRTNPLDCSVSSKTTTHSNSGRATSSGRGYRPFI